MRRCVENYISFIDEIAANPLEKNELRTERKNLKKQLGTSEIPDEELYQGIAFLTKILLDAQRALMGPNN